MFARKVTGLPVISLARGSEIGHVHSLLVDPQQTSIAALVLTRSFMREAQFINYQEVRGIGAHAVTVENGNAQRLVRGFTPSWIRNASLLLGARVLTEDGTALGFVADYEFNPPDGKILGLEVLPKKSLWRASSLYLPAALIISIGREMVIVRAEAAHVLPPPRVLRWWGRARKEEENLSE